MLIKNMAGTIAFECRKNIGMRFYFDLPEISDGNKVHRQGVQ
jgi:hypothetical protein